MTVLHVRDTGKGVDPASVAIDVDGNIVYSGDVESSNTGYGLCVRGGAKADFTYLYQPKESTDKQAVVAVKARDLAGNVIPERTHLFDTATATPDLSQNVAPEQAGVDQNAARGQPNGLVAVVWQDDRAGNQDVYMATSTDAFITAEVTAVTSDDADQTDPVVFLGSEDAIFVRWMDIRNGSTALAESPHEP